MLLQGMFANFVEQKPYCVMARAALERMLSATRLDALFEAQAQQQYTRELLFSQLVEVISRVVTRVDSSVFKSIQALDDVLTVSDEAVYQKLRKVEPRVCQALVRDSFQVASGVLEKMQVVNAPCVKGLKTKILDGNSISASEHRIEELRTIWDAPLPGRTLVVWDQSTHLVSELFLSECGHAQERSMLGEVLETVEKNDLWMMDRNFCTLWLLFGIWERGARFVVRQHGSLVGKTQGNSRAVGTTARGEQVTEQTLTLTHAGRERTVRRITVHLLKPTRDGSRELHILTTLTERQATGVKVAELYQQRWTIENIVHEMTTCLQCEINTLGYPRAALYVFAVAALLENTLAMLKGSLRAAHGDEAVDALADL